MVLDISTKVLRLINNRTKAFCSSFKILFVSERYDINLDFNISFLRIGQILRALQELEGKMQSTMKPVTSFILAAT